MGSRDLDQVAGKHALRFSLGFGRLFCVLPFFLCVFCLPFSRISRHFCTFAWFSGCFFRPFACSWDCFSLRPCVFLAFLRPSLCCFLQPHPHTVLGRITGQPSRVITTTPRISRQGTPSGRPEQPPALSS